jgi:hypothetical protein
MPRYLCKAKEVINMGGGGNECSDCMEEMQLIHRNYNQRVQFFLCLYCGTLEAIHYTKDWDIVEGDFIKGKVSLKHLKVLLK